MENIFDITCNGERIGEATLTKEGLFYKIHCLCNLPEDRPYLVTLKAGQMINLGLLAREGDALGLTKRIAVKRLGDVRPEFEVTMREQTQEKTFYPIEVGKPFEHLDKLKEATVEEQNGSLGIVLSQEDPAPAIPGSDQSPESEDESAPEECGCPDPEM